MAVHPCLGHSSRISPDIAGVAVGQIEHEKVRLLFHPADDNYSLPKVRLAMPGRMGQRHKHFLTAPLPLAHVVLDDRVAAGKSMFITQPVKYPLGRMALLARHRPVLVKPPINDRGERVQLRASHRRLPPITRRNRIRQHLANRIARDAEMPGCFALAHAAIASQTNLQI